MKSAYRLFFIFLWSHLEPFLYKLWIYIVLYLLKKEYRLRWKLYFKFKIDKFYLFQIRCIQKILKFERYIYRKMFDFDRWYAWTIYFWTKSSKTLDVLWISLFWILYYFMYLINLINIKFSVVLFIILSFMFKSINFFKRESEVFYLDDNTYRGINFYRREEELFYWYNKKIINGWI
uniref:Uncharacterized protein n=1 Tax=Strombidium sp. TaxID=181122 RepID=A0A7T0Q532_9SPIT|nr:hypothetical protein [Strombidium sp.]